MLPLGPAGHNCLGKPAADLPWTHNVQGGALFPPGQAFNGVVLCNPRDGNSQFPFPDNPKETEWQSLRLGGEPLFRDHLCEMGYSCNCPWVTNVSNLLALLPDADPRRQCSLLRQCCSVCTCVYARVRECGCRGQSHSKGKLACWDFSHPRSLFLK